MKLKEAWETREKWNKDYFIPSYDREMVKKNTNNAPVWLHFGAGNIFRAFIAAAMDTLLEQGLSDRGIIVCEDYDKELVNRVYAPYDCISLMVTLRSDGKINKRVIGSVTEAVTDTERMKKLVQMPSVQLISFTITEKGYQGPLMRKMAELCLERYHGGAWPIALVSMDNCAHNGELLSSAVRMQAQRLVEEGKAEQGFLDYLEDESKVSFPWTMIDKITPRPDETVKELLESEGFENVEQIITSCNTYTAPFVNAEETEYLVIEDKFPNGRPNLEAAGVLFADKEIVDKTEKMKVGTCLNPLHTALAVFGCLLGYETIHAEMEDPQLKKLVCELGYKEGMPVVVNPGIIQPEQFLKDVLEKRLPNPFMPDSPYRIATDTSQKIPVRFGHTLQAYSKSSTLEVKELKMIPLVFAGWLRYLIGVDDQGAEFTRSSDPRLEALTEQMKGIELGKEIEGEQGIDLILQDQSIFGIDLYQTGLADKVKVMFKEMAREKGAVRKVLQKYCI
ncbi:mannitol dehydrogenase family protein [Anaeromicropila populeti]|uniref:Fructuronate reductase n=1 Tax=Anaeromicropila populeti TaxID=37658 RepID=A0A1I6JIE9_9FIRM|nr:mannitol dehydrogenase family protein [Anaeromicropila populeti]SFR78400.1 fructuronate reductase [Anaeromicropila populeti]